MEITEIKNRIIEKIESEKAKPSRRKKRFDLATLSARMGKSEEEVARLFNIQSSSAEKLPDDYRERLDILEEENLRLKTTQEHSRAKSDNLLKEIETRDRAIAELQARLKTESIGLIKDGEKGKSLINTAIEKSIGEYSAKLTALEKENRALKATHADAVKKNEDIFVRISEKDKEMESLRKGPPDGSGETEKSKKLKKLHEDALKQNDSLLIRIEEKDSKIAELEKSLEEAREKVKKIQEHERAVETHRTEKEKATANMETLRSKLYVAAKETKEQSARIAQLEDVLKHRDKRLADSDKAYKNLEKEKNDILLKFQESEEARRALDGKIKALGEESEAKDKKVIETERLCNKNIAAAKKELDLHMQAAERSRKALEGKIEHLKAELDAKNKHIDETENAARELDTLVKDSEVRLHAAEAAKADLEERIGEAELEAKEAARKWEIEKAAKPAKAGKK